RLVGGHPGPRARGALRELRPRPAVAPPRAAGTVRGLRDLAAGVAVGRPRRAPARLLAGGARPPPPPVAPPPPPPPPPADRPRPARRSERGGVHRFALSRDLGEELARSSREAGATLFMTVLASLAALLSQLTGAEDLAIGTPVANRSRREIEGLIGFFV